MKKETKTILVETVKLALSVITGIGTEIIFGCIAKESTEGQGLSTTGKICVGIAGGVVGAMVSNAADEFIDKSVDQVLETADKLLSMKKQPEPKGDDI